MPEKKAAIINVSKGLMNVSFITLAAIGSATGNPVVAGITALPQALSLSGMLKSLLEGKQEEQLELPVPHWWTMEPQCQSWKAVCSSIESHLPAILSGVEENLRKETTYPSSDTVKNLFVEQVAQQFSPWEVSQQDCQMVATYVTPLLLEKTSDVLKEAIDTTRQDALAQWLAQVANKLDTIQKAMTTITPPLLVTSTAPSTQAAASPQDASIIALHLASKMQAGLYDVYICYDEEDKVDVMMIGEQLKTCGILPWFDVVDVQPGVPRKLQQEEQIKKVSAAAMFIGQHVIERGQLLQMYAFIEQYIDRECAVIPVLLPDAPQKPELPPFLAEFGWVDFRKQMPNPLEQLIWGITGQHP